MNVFCLNHTHILLNKNQSTIIKKLNNKPLHHKRDDLKYAFLKKTNG